MLVQLTVKIRIYWVPNTHCCAYLVLHCQQVQFTVLNHIVSFKLLLQLLYPTLFYFIKLFIQFSLALLISNRVSTKSKTKPIISTMNNIVKEQNHMGQGPQTIRQ